MLTTWDDEFIICVLVKPHMNDFYVFFLFNFFFYIQLYMYFTFEKAYYMPTIKINSVGLSFGHFDDVILIVKAAL